MNKLVIHGRSGKIVVIIIFMSRWIGEFLNDVFQRMSKEAIVESADERLYENTFSLFYRK
jgi:hypothetical protein